jgi:hypothetical protein
VARKTTISIEESTHERLKDHKPDNLTFDEFLTALADEFGEVNYRIEFSGIED